MRVRPGRAGELKALLAGVVNPSGAEAGNMHWDIWQDQANADIIILDELYADNAAVAAHCETPHFRDYFAVINDLAERRALVLDPVQIA